MLFEHSFQVKQEYIISLRELAYIVGKMVARSDGPTVEMCSGPVLAQRWATGQPPLAANSEPTLSQPLLFANIEPTLGWRTCHPGANGGCQRWANCSLSLAQRWATSVVLSGNVA